MMMPANPRAARWVQLRAFIDHWCEPLTPGNGVTAEELAVIEARRDFPMPQALREWYQLAGKRGDLTSGQNSFLAPAEFGSTIDDDHLILYIENQAVCQWGVRLLDLTLDDPSVFRSDDETGTWILDTGALSEFIFQVVVFEASISPDTQGWHGAAEITPTDEQIQRLDAQFDQLHLSPWDWPAGNSHSWVTDELIMFYEGVLLLLMVTKKPELFTELETILSTTFEYHGEPPP